MRATAQYMTPEEVDLEKLTHIVNGSIIRVAASCNLPKALAAEILKSIRVERLADVKTAVQGLDSHALSEFELYRLGLAVEDALKAMVNATDLDTQEVTDILSEDRGASITDIVHRLREESRIHRFSNS